MLNTTDRPNTLDNRKPGLLYKKNRRPLHDRIGRDPYSVKELASAIGYSREYMSQVLNHKVKMSPMCALILHHYSKGFLDPHKLLEEYGNAKRDKEKLDGLIARYKDTKICKNPMSA